MSLGHILFCPGSSHLGYKQGGKKKGAREQGMDGGRGTPVLSLTLCLLLYEVFTRVTSLTRLQSVTCT